MDNNDNKLDILTKKIYEEGIEKVLSLHSSLYVKMMSVIIVLLSITSNNCFGQTILNDPHWELVWEDNFDYLDLSTWKVANNFDHYGEQQVYTNRSNNVFVSNGNLVLKVQKEEYHCTELNNWACNKEWYSYTSGWVETKASKNVQYGLIQARIKLPYGYGFWPAFWTFIGDGISGVNAAEIDIFEMLGHLPSNIITTNIHTDYGNEPNNYQEYSMGSYADVYHNYAVAWSPDKIVWYVDGCPIRISTNHNIVDPVRIILNFAIETSYSPNSSTPFPSEMYVDYVKVYKLKNDCSNSIDVCNLDLNTLDYRVKKNIKIGGTNCSNSIPVGKNVYLRATNSFEIEGRFSVPIGSSLFIDVNPCY